MRLGPLSTSSEQLYELKTRPIQGLNIRTNEPLKNP